mmetsp:Transcript_935/g.3584  ORF Transcript_935/g.3584 Transcript_935/m.3584 type:complete len:205 (-) Transcript_935:787-1401(-)
MADGHVHIHLPRRRPHSQPGYILVHVRRAVPAFPGFLSMRVSRVRGVSVRAAFRATREAQATALCYRNNGSHHHSWSVPNLGAGGWVPVFGPAGRRDVVTELAKLSRRRRFRRGGAAVAHSVAPLDSRPRGERELLLRRDPGSLRRAVFAGRGVAAKCGCEVRWWFYWRGRGGRVEEKTMTTVKVFSDRKEKVQSIQVSIRKNV